MTHSNDPLASQTPPLSEELAKNVLLLSQRRLADLVAFSITYEFEDTLVDLLGADRVDAQGRSALELSRRVYKATRYATGSRSLAASIAPNPRTVPLHREYDLFFPVFNYTHEVYALTTMPGWRQRCRHAACYIIEVWPHLLPEYLLELLSEFDHIFIGGHNSVDAVARMTGRPCSYLPLASDVLRFAPAPSRQARPIDVCNIGRRSAVTHQALLGMAEAREIFYYFDTVAASGHDLKQRTFRVDAPSEHRRMLASLLQHSRYFIANRSRINEPDYTAGREEISSRYYEGAAAGTVMIGEPPATPEFKALFDWPDAVVPVPFNSADIGDLLADLDRAPDRVARIRSANVANAALRHDWLHRIEVVFDTLGLTPTAAMRQRAARLNAVAQAASPLALAQAATP